MPNTIPIHLLRFAAQRLEGTSRLAALECTALKEADGSSGCGPTSQSHDFTPDIPQSEIVATNFYDRAKFWAKNWAKNRAKFWTKFSGHFRASFAVQNDPPNLSPNSSQFITPCLVTAPVTEISKFHLRELLGLGVPK